MLIIVVTCDEVNSDDIGDIGVTYVYFAWTVVLYMWILLYM